ncbi:MAG TPA: GntR family transcriptional regulator [Burkholderiales bacterium]|nr:GntR family transcriptional regulator [Burkholderiales bacterium]
MDSAQIPVAVDSAAPPSPRLLHEEGVDRLRELIMQGQLAPGTKLNERVLCEQLGISRTPLREALKYLASEGLVELLPNRGAIVAPLDPARLQQIFAVLEALEGLAGELACRNATEQQLREIRALHFEMLAHHARHELTEYFRCNQEIHIRIVEATGNEPLVQIYRSLNTNARRARYMANLSQERWDKAVEEHNEILDALTRRDAARLQRLLREHLENKLTLVMEALAAQQPGDGR